MENGEVGGIVGAFLPDWIKDFIGGRGPTDLVNRQPRLPSGAMPNPSLATGQELPSDDQRIIDLLLQGIGGGSGGGSGGPAPRYEWDDPQYRNIAEREISLLEDAEARKAFEFQKELELEESRQAWNEAMDLRDYALQVGDLRLAEQAEANAAYFEQKSLETQQAIENARNQTDIATSKIGAEASMFGSETSARANIISAQIRAAQAREDSTNRMLTDLANAQNDADRNNIIAAWNQEQAQIAKMQDETERLLGTQRNKVDLFRGETERAGVLGDLAQRQNELLLKASSTPRDLFGLYFMQRGIAPDWNALASGNPAVGEALVPQNALTAYVPQTEVPTIENINQAAGQVGQATQYRPGPNQIIAEGMNRYNNIAGSDASSLWSGIDMSLPQRPDLSGYQAGTANVNIGAPPQAQHSLDMPMIDVNPAGRQGGVPIAALKPGLNLSTVGGGDITGANFDLPAFWDADMTMPIKPEDIVKGGSQVYVYKAPVQGQEIPYGDDVKVSQLNKGGVTRAPIALIGDSRGKDPDKNAKPELVINRTGAPLEVLDYNKTKKVIRNLDREDYKRYATGTGGMTNTTQSNVGQDVSQQYANSGLGQTYIQSSGNQHTQGIQLPHWLNVLNQYGAPLAPSLVASTTGRTLPTLQTGAAFTGRGGGVLPSLQTIGRQTQGETELLKAYSEGPVGISWGDVMDYITRSTSNLQRARRATGGV